MLLRKLDLVRSLSAFVINLFITIIIVNFYHYYHY